MPEPTPVPVDVAELLPCPFCGCEPHHTAPTSDRAGWEIIQCWSCGAQIQHYKNRPKAIAAWNRRVTPRREGTQIEGWAGRFAGSDDYAFSPNAEPQLHMRAILTLLDTEK
jgi:Lar family restriction alleviation protein